MLKKKQLKKIEVLSAEQLKKVKGGEDIIITDPLEF